MKIDENRLGEAARLCPYYIQGHQAISYPVSLTHPRYEFEATQPESEPALEPLHVEVDDQPAVTPGAVSDWSEEDVTPVQGFGYFDPYDTFLRDPADKFISDLGLNAVNKFVCKSNRKAIENNLGSGIVIAYNAVCPVCCRWTRTPEQTCASMADPVGVVHTPWHADNLAGRLASLGDVPSTSSATVTVSHKTPGPHTPEAENLRVAVEAFMRKLVDIVETDDPASDRIELDTLDASDFDNEC